VWVVGGARAAARARIKAIAWGRGRGVRPVRSEAIDSQI
jgi:hypothetical protein